ncbi:MAG: cryptochrome/photolyase family protein [Neisseriaceae bacterium]
MREELVIFWFRQDLRLSDNPGLFEATQHGKVLPIYILDNDNSDKYKMGGASKLWLHHSLNALNQSLNLNLSLYCGDPLTILLKLCLKYNIKRIFWNRCYEHWRINRDKEIKETLLKRGIDVKSYNGSLLWEPWLIKKNDGAPYKVFTPFYYKGCLNAISPRDPLSKPDALVFYKDNHYSVTINDLKLLSKVGWSKKIAKYWSFGEAAAQDSLSRFLNHGINNYKEGRNYPAKSFISKLSPYLHFGEISPNQVWYAVRQLGDNFNIESFCSELGWREFSYSQLYYNPHLANKNLQKKFDDFPWQHNPEKLIAWQKGQTGIPMVDAGMRELWETGYMHNRVRMIVGSFLVKNLLINWQHGERWFWDCLVDADLASNSASWQWVAGCGADAAPYFRVFNPVTQGQKFDPDGEYIRHYVPELKNLPNQYLFSPWEAPQMILNAAGVELGVNYPKPIVNLSLSRELAIKAFASLKNTNNHDLE